MLFLIVTFVIPGISWTGHVGGLVVGGVLGFLLPPSGVTSLAGLWRRPDGDHDAVDRYDPHFPQKGLSSGILYPHSKQKGI